jgi:hypothetical protein
MPVFGGIGRRRVEVTGFKRKKRVGFRSPEAADRLPPNDTRDPPARKGPRHADHAPTDG